MRISTCRHMRFKMNIDNDFKCSKCNDAVENLEHIFIHCLSTLRFIKLLNTFIRDKFLAEYQDESKFHFITCCHDNKVVNYLNLIAKWFISRCFQTGMELSWFNFLRNIKKLLCGDLKLLREPILAALDTIPGS